jgi:hypothetical protein
MKKNPVTPKSKIEDYRAFFKSKLKCKHYHPKHFFFPSPFTKEDLLTKSRKNEVLEWRICGIVWMVCCGMNSREVGELFEVDHATVYHHMANMQNALEGYNPSLSAKFQICADCSHLYGEIIDERKVKVYISGAISSNPNYIQDLENAKKTVASLNEGYIPISPVDLPHEHDKSWESYMREDIKELMNCEAIFLMKGWRMSQGAQIEAQIARYLNFRIIHELED